MTFDRKEWLDHQNEKQKQHIDGQRQHLELLHQQAVHADLLTGDQTWNLFLQYLQAVKQHCIAESDKFTAQFKNPDLVNVDEMMRLKVMGACLEDRIKLLDAIMTLPKDLKKQGETAKSLLDRLQE